MRSLNYVQRVSLDFSGTLFPHAICLGDADNDTLNELVVGDTSGKVHVYKNDDSKAWITRTCAGMLTCVAVGDVCNKGKNFVVAVGAEGWFHLFDLSAAKADPASQHEGFAVDEQKPFFTQHIPANTRVILISDIDGDGRSELVVGYTDRVVRAFRWEEPSDASDSGSGQLVLLKKWLLDGQVDSLSVNPGPEGLPELMVSQPGCGYAILLCSWTQQDSPAAGDEDSPAPSGRYQNSAEITPSCRQSDARAGTAARVSTSAGGAQVAKTRRPSDRCCQTFSTRTRTDLLGRLHFVRVHKRLATCLLLLLLLL